MLTCGNVPNLLPCDKQAAPASGNSGGLAEQHFVEVFDGMSVSPPTDTVIATLRSDA